MIEDRYFGCYDSVADYAEEITDLSEVPQHLQYYINFEAFARDIEFNGEVISIKCNSEYLLFIV